MAWKRPDNVPYPSTWSKFVGNNYPDMEPLQYRIQDITEDLFEDVINHMTHYFLLRENTCATSGFIEDEKSVKEIRTLWRDHILSQKMGLVALVTNHESGKLKIAGINMTYVVHVSEKDHVYNFEGGPLKKAWNTLKDLEGPLDVFKKFNVDRYMGALGLSVAPQYHGENIGYQLLMARTKLCQATGIPLTVTAFTGPASQHVAHKAGFHKIAELNYETYKQNGKIAYPKLKGSQILMAKEINENTDR